MPAATPDQDDDYQQFLQDVQTSSSGRPATGASAPASNVPPASSGDPDYDDFLNDVAKSSAATAPSPLPKPKAAEQEGGYWENVPMGTEQAPMPISSMLHGAASNILPDIGHAAASGYEAIKDWQNTVPAMWGAVQQIATGIDSKIDGYAGKPQDTVKKAQDEALINAIGSDLSDKYGDWESAKHTLANHPFDALSTVSAAFAGPEMLLGKAPGILGTVGRAAGTVSELTNPLNPGGVLTKAMDVAAPAVKSVTLSPETDAAIKAASGGKLSAADFMDPANPNVQAGAEKIFSQKGITPATVNEAALRSFGAPAPEPVVMGKPAVPMAQQAVENAVKDAHTQAAGAAADIAGAASPESGAIADQLEKSYIDSYNTYKQNYANVAANTGIFDPAIGKTVMSAIGKELSSYKLPATPGLIAKNSDLPQAQEALKAINDRLVKNDMPLGGPIDMNNLDRLRQGLNGFLDNADKTDKMAMRAIIDGYDKNIINAAKGGLFSGNGTEVVNDMNTARQSFKNHMDTFANPSGNNSFISTATKRFANDTNGFQKGPTGLIESQSQPEVHNAVQAGMGKALLDPAKGPDLYNKLLNATGGPGSDGEQALKSFVRQSMLESQNGVMKLHPDKIDDMINAPHGIARKVFAPDEISAIKRINYGRRVLMTKPSGPAHVGSLINGVGGRLARGAVTSGIGHMIGGYPGAVAAGAAEQGLEGMLAKRKIAKSMQGAPVAPNKIGKIGSLGRAAVSRKPTLIANQLSNAANLTPEEQPNTMAQSAGGRTERASGGRIMDHDAEADRLVRAADMAKNSVNKTTEKLLDVPDEAIIKALDVAQQAI